MRYLSTLGKRPGWNWAVLIVAMAALLRLWQISFGLPAFYDPDEAMFMLKGIELLLNKTANPGWFGHPGTTTIYTVAIIEASSGAIGILSGQHPDVDAFVKAAFQNPTPLVLTARLFIFACAISCVWFTYIIGKKLFTENIGLIGALFLSFNSLHIQQSQIVRTDIHATFFMLLAFIFAINIYEKGRWRSYLFAGISLGFACATKWPTAIAGIALLAAAWLRWRDEPAGSYHWATGFGLIFGFSAVGLFIASPYVFFDFSTVLRNLSGEARASHPGATGFGFWGNLKWYFLALQNGSLGIPGMLALFLGGIVTAKTNRLAGATILLFSVVFLLAISLQSLVWARWLLPILPFISIFMALGAASVASQLSTLTVKFNARNTAWLLAAAIAIPMLILSFQQIVERGNDTRQQSSQWAIKNIPKGSSLLIEYFAFDFIQKPWVLKFPAGNMGCVNVQDMLHGGFDVAKSEDLRGNRAIIDIGSVDQNQLDSCRADYLILTNFARYRDDLENYPEEFNSYRKLIETGTILEHFKPESGVRGGPEVLIVKTRAIQSNTSR